MLAKHVGILLPLVVGLGACSTPGSYVPPTADEPSALVVGENPSIFAALDPLSSRGDTRIAAVDDEATTQSGWSGYPAEVTVHPGNHTLRIHGAVMVGGRIIASGEASVFGMFRKGRTYRVRSLLQPGGAINIGLSEAKDESTDG